MAEEKPIYIYSPFRPSVARKIKTLAKKSKRALGRQVEWIVERFFEER